MKKRNKKKLLKAVRLVAKNIDILEQALQSKPKKVVVEQTDTEKEFSEIKKHIEKIKKEDVPEPMGSEIKKWVKRNEIIKSTRPTKKKEDFEDVEEYYKAVINEVVGGDSMKKSMYKASKAIRVEAKKEKEQLEMYNKMELVDGIIELFEKYIYKQIDLVSKIKKQKPELSFADKIAVNNIIKENANIKCVE